MEIIDHNQFPQIKIVILSRSDFFTEFEILIANWKKN